MSGQMIGCSSLWFLYIYLFEQVFAEQGVPQPSALKELQQRVIKAEETLEQKEEENAALREQVQQFETRWSEYEAKMKSMEEMWQKQMSSLQVSFHVPSWT